MIIRKCTDISKDALHKLSLEGYKDYILDVSMDYDTFYDKFVAYSGIDLDHSFVALIDEQPVGFILGSINDYEEMKTLRCAAFAVKKEYRNKKIGDELFKKHIALGEKNKCERLFLEVIKSNKAKHFYLERNYQILDELFYYTLDLKKAEVANPAAIDFIAISNDDICHYLSENKVHINYQNHPVVLKNSETNKYYHLTEDGQSIGVISYSTSGALSIMHLKPDYQKKKYLESILFYLKSNVLFEDLRLSVTSEVNYVSLFNSVGFVKDALEQFEMVKYL